MNEEEFDNWIVAYIEIYTAKNNLDEHHPHYWAIEQFVELEAGDPELCWKAILTIVAAKPAPIVLANLGSGPMEELLELHGVAYIDRIEKEARQNSDFQSLLHDVWGLSDDKIWQRVLTARLNS